MELYRESAARAGHDANALPISINGHGYVGRTSQHAREAMYPYFAKGYSRIEMSLRDVEDLLWARAGSTGATPDA